ncbi:protein phosphatase [Thermosyntropha lipolytica DSM 11003]|uniref:Protein phosphatase n=1 Tax=Thermosyntropha lipolytica DSM 11003 TaxID=1123382 RepID=A0A1M5RR95_9FIRM|nr:Stp1/IreP family PP2C-type Ser/Thr phosphatase [Thermosyntropha lipolytica]SHH28709.1 protein phosphatase [Thermosyntropha lipolytica DSM 11003]
MKSIGISDQGLIRHRNEDSFFIRESQSLFVVCDGMGGHKAGHIASNLAIEIIARETENLDRHELIKFIDEIIKKANRQIWEAGQNDPSCYEMGTTITAAIINENEMHIRHIGDSRLYIVRENRIRQVTRDHTLAEQMLEDGLLNAEELAHTSYNHILTRALGIEEEVQIDHYIESLLVGDIILLCTDGLTDMLADDEILEIVTEAGENLEQAAEKLVAEAIARGGYDNITLILICI